MSNAKAMTTAQRLLAYKKDNNGSEKLSFAQERSIRKAERKLLKKEN